MQGKGTDVLRLDGVDKVTGNAKFVADLCPGAALTGKILGSTYAHARVVKINTEEAESLDGMIKVLTFKDVPKDAYTPCGHPFSFNGSEKKNMHLLTDHPRFVGDPVAAVIAEDELTAERALSFLKVEYEILPHMLTIEEALKEGAMCIHEDSPGNIMADFGEFFSDNYDGNALENAEFMAVGCYKTQPVQHCHIEPCGSFAHMDGRGRITVVSSTQIPFLTKHRCSEALGVPESRIRIVKPCVGGGFGNKQDALQEPLNAFMAMQVPGRTVKLIYSREECMIITRSRYAFNYDIKIGADRSGKFEGIDMYCVGNGGAYATHNHSIALTGTSFFRFIYDYGMIHSKPVTVYTNTPSGGAMRGYGAPQAAFAVESAIDDLALKLKMDPLDLRMKNIRKPGYIEEETGIEVFSNGLEECLKKGRDLIGWDSKKKIYAEQNTGNIRRGLGVGVLGFVCATVPFNVEVSGARITLNEDGSYILQIGATEIGQGSDTVFAQIAAEVLHADVEDIHVVSMQDTDISPYDCGAFATRQTYACGSAVVKAAEELQEKIYGFVEKLKGICKDNLEIRGHMIWSKDEKKPIISMRDMALNTYFNKTQGSVLTSDTSITFKRNVVSFGCTFAEVEVDISLCKATVKEIYNIHDSGRIINRQLAGGQVHGGMSMGIGYGLMEQMTYNDQGKLLNDNLLDYKLPTAMDVPDLGVDFADTYDPVGPLGAKGIGEPPAVSPAAAIRNAILDATGIAFNRLPITPQAMFEKFSEAGMIG